MIKRIREWFNTWNDPMPFVAGGMQEYNSGIDDGVDYSQPFIVPGWLDADERQKVIESLKESVSSQSYRSQFGNPQRTAYDLPIQMATEDPLKEWAWQTRVRVLNNCHAAYQRNPLAHAAITFTSLFVVGNGFNLSTQNKDVEQILLDFINNPDNALRDNEVQAVTDLQLDGELITRFFDENGETVIAPMRPWELEWIDTEPGFFRRAKTFKFQTIKEKGDSPGGQETEQIEVSADDIQFVAVNRGRYELRGRPELYRILPWLRADKEWLEDRARQNKWRNALLWHVKVQGVAASIAAVMNRWRKPPTPGSAYVSTNKEEVLPLTNNVGAGDAANDGRSIRLMTVIGAMLPEYFFGDGENANLASATKQELPALTKFEAYQHIMTRQYYTPMFKRVVQAAVDAGLLPEMVDVQDPDGKKMKGQDPVKAIDSFEVTYEPVSGEDLTALSNLVFGSMERGILSDKSAQERLGFDPHEEDKRLNQQREKEAELMTQGLMPYPPGTVPAGMEADDIEDDPEDEQQPEPEAA